jgi:hypothetical protein
MAENERILPEKTEVTIVNGDFTYANYEIMAEWFNFEYWEYGRLPENGLNAVIVGSRRHPYQDRILYFLSCDDGYEYVVAPESFELSFPLLDFI